MSLAQVAWVRPQAPIRSDLVADPAEHLDYMVVKVNDQSRVLKNGGELAVVRGDKVTITDVAIMRGGPYQGKINVVGFQRSDKPSEDRGALIDTAKDLPARWSEAGRGDLYAIVAESGSKLYGHSYLKLIEPVLRYAEITVNGARRVLRDGETTAIGADDQVKVDKIVTNLEGDSDVYVQIAAAADNNYEIRFLRGSLVFAKIPLTVSASARKQ